MRLLAVELNDSGIVLAGDAGGEELRQPQPGQAVLHDGHVLLGAAAAARSRITPLFAQNRYWQQLGVERLPWSTEHVRTQADLAFAQLASLIEPYRPGAEGLLLAVPPGYSREQLGLLLGIANETGVPARGLVDLAVAACAAEASAPHLLHVDLQLHQAAVTVLEHARADGALRRTRYEILPGTGVLAFQQALLELVATVFVHRTRFDPLHEAATEQRLFDGLPGWTAALEGAEEVEAQIECGTHTHRVVLTREAFVAAVERPLADLQRLVQAARPAGLVVQLCVSATAAALPGLCARLDALRDCTLTRLPAGAAARGALEHSAAIVRPAEGMALVHRLPLGREPKVAPAAAAPAGVEWAETPTHLLYGGHAWPITTEPLALGSAATGDSRAPRLPAGTPGLSRSHCSLRMAAGAALVEDHSTYGTFVNDERVAGQLALRVGDVLRLGTPGISLELIRVDPGDGTT